MFRSLWQRANARNVRLYYPYWQYTNLFIFWFVKPIYSDIITFFSRSNSLGWYTWHRRFLTTIFNAQYSKAAARISNKLLPKAKRRDIEWDDIYDAYAMYKCCKWDNETGLKKIQLKTIPSPMEMACTNSSHVERTYLHPVTCFLINF